MILAVTVCLAVDSLLNEMGNESQTMISSITCDKRNLWPIFIFVSGMCPCILSDNIFMSTGMCCSG
jgi:hypothetical protein